MDLFRFGRREPPPVGPDSDDAELMAAVAALCERVVVMRGGRVVFEGTPAGLATAASGQVWLSDHPPAASRLFWRTADGRYRTLGERPAGAVPAVPAIEDGYLLLLGDAAGVAA
ncbi:hypothetical protein [Streptosporangium pseudovulgare]|uniref:Uncharacterized protein n=1 Tax=Streptosporangium pseudovulgare TaxID=35765 RepID=A0ABQ2R4S6_9ACTN|nr:hypothetical protein [Streptosporangium pseudovulgare]GGQ09899.1 hypothetical protein GCM10010140_45240 [Streptosporangium pseudovulgare]